MDRPRLIRGLGIAWSVWWGILGVLLVVLWVRSFRTMDDFRLAALRVQSMRGRLIIMQISMGSGWIVVPVDRHDGTDWNEWDRRFYWWSLGFANRGNLQLIFPHLFALLASLGCAISPWIHWSR